MNKRYQVRSCRGISADVPWDTAELLSDFAFPWEDRDAPRTEFRALWNENYFHFRFDCGDNDLVLATGTDAMEKVIGSDRVEIFFAPDLDLQPYYCLEMDPRGEVLDYEARFHRQMDWTWFCPGLELENKRSDGGYRVQGKIPLESLRQLGVLKSDSAEFHAGVYRAEFSHPEKAGDPIDEGWMAWVDPATEEPDFHVPSSFGTFELVESGPPN